MVLLFDRLVDGTILIISDSNLNVQVRTDLGLLSLRPFVVYLFL